MIDSFINLEATLIHREEAPLTMKHFSVQLGFFNWEGTLSTMIIIKDMTIIKTHYEKLSRHKDKLLATFSHGLKTPMNGILGMLEISIEEVNDLKTKDRLTIAINCTRLLQNTIFNILDFSLMLRI